MGKSSKKILAVIGIFFLSAISIIGLSYLFSVSTAAYHPPAGDRKYSYLHYIPNSALGKSPVRILLYTHGSPQKEDYTAMENYVKYNEFHLIKPYCDKYGYALIIMITPRLWGDYPDYKMNTQSMNRWVMMDNEFDKPSYEFYKRPDLEFIKVIDDFKQIMQEQGFMPDEKVYMGGFSNGGLQANRFTILHPDHIAATAIGAAGAYIYPLKKINNIKLTYPVGIADVDSIPQTHYNFQLFKTIPHLIFVGENDLNYNNDPVPHDDNFDKRQALIINTYFGSNQVLRAEIYASYLSSIGMDCRFHEYEGVGHQFNREMIEAMFVFFENH